MAIDINLTDVASATNLNAHTTNQSNPHAVTKTQVGLGNVDNTSDVNKPISTLTQNALNNKQDTLVSGTNIKTINGTTILGSGDLVVQQALKMKSGAVLGSTFAGLPKKVTITFAGAFADVNYSVSIIGNVGRIWTIESQLAGSFIINAGSNTTPTGSVYWIAIKHGEN